MPYVKCISCHTSAHAVRRYLERGGRALATDFLNIDVPVFGVREGLEDHGRVDWWREVDSARRLRKRHRLEWAPRADVEALHIRPDILAASASLSDIPARAGNASRGIWRMSSFMGWPTVLSSRIWCSWVATRPKESRLFDVASREIPVESCMCKATRGVRPR